MKFVMNQWNDNYNILFDFNQSLDDERSNGTIPGHPRRSKLGEIVILSAQHPYAESKQVEPNDSCGTATK